MNFFEAENKKCLIFSFLCVTIHFVAGMMELADVLDSKSSGSDTVRVRPPLPAPKKQPYFVRLFLFFTKQLHLDDLKIKDFFLGDFYENEKNLC